MNRIVIKPIGTDIPGLAVPGAGSLPGAGQVNGARPNDEDFQQILKKAVESGEDKELKEAAKQFEAMFLYEMFKKMRESVPKGGLFNESMGEKVYQSMLDMEISAKAAESGGLGLAEVVYQQLKRK